MSEFFKGLADSLRNAEASDWQKQARPNQLPPPGDWRIWLLLAGRGFGKTRTVCEFVRGEVEAGRAARIALVAATSADCRDVLVEGPAGILAISPKWCRPVYEPTKRRLSWPNGAVASLFSADEPERLRGPQHDLAVCDELAAWRYPEALDMLLLGLRLGKNPRVAIATTPRPTRIIRELIAREGKDVAVTRGSTLENRNNLAAAYIEQIIERYKGTRLERQEIHGELLEDTPGALWNRDILEQTRVAEAPQMQRIVVAIDPAGSSEEGADETGIVVAGLGQDGHGYVLDDLSGRYAPTEWARRALGAFHVWKADRIVAETNYGGEMVKATIESIDALVPVRTISSSRGKVLRAEPIAAFFEQHKAHVVGSQPELEDQACRFTSDWTRSRDGSPDRVDSMVFALTELMLGLPAGGFFRESMFLDRGEPVETVGMLRPSLCFAAIGTSHNTGPGHDGVAVLYCAYRDYAGVPLTILDWEIVPHEVALMGEWLPQVNDRVSGWAHTLGALLPTGAILMEPTAIGAPLLQLGAVRGIYTLDPAEFRDEQELPADLPARVNFAARFIGTGKLARMTRDARDKMAPFRGVTRNHFLGQVLGYASDRAEQPAEFIHALCLTALLAFGKNIAAERQLAEDPPTPEPAPAGPPPKPGLMLTVGRHTIDGQAVDVPPDGARVEVFVPLEPGRHQIDGKQFWVQPPSVGFRVY